MKHIFLNNIKIFIELALIMMCIQAVRAQPKMLLDLDVHFTKPVGNFRGYRPAIGYTGLDESYGVYFGIGFNANFKYAISKQRNSRLTAGLTTSRFLTQSFSKDPNSSGDNTDVRVHSLSIGYEYAVLPKKTVNPYLGAAITVNMLNASYYWIDHGVSGKNDFRMGILADAGLDIWVNKNGGLILGTKLHYANLIGKSADPASLGNKTDIPLNDASYTYKGKNYGPINIVYFWFYLGYRFTLSK